MSIKPFSEAKKGDMCRLKNGRWALVEDLGTGAGDSARLLLMPNYDGQYATTVSYYPISGMPNRISLQNGVGRLPDEDFPNWCVSDVVSAYKPPYEFKVGDKGLTDTGDNYVILRKSRLSSESDYLLVWVGDGIDSLQWYSRTGELKTPNGKPKLLPPTK